MKRMIAGEICLPLMFAAMMMISCERREQKETIFDLSMKGYDVVMMSEVKSMSVPDTNDFVLDIKEDGGGIIYSGTYGGRPQCVKVFDGTYLFKVQSDTDLSPAFEHPVYGAFVEKTVAGGGVVPVHFECSQVNTGVKLTFEEDFKDKFKNGYVIMKDDSGKVIEYEYGETRVAYFRPGNVRFSIKTDNWEQMLLDKNLQADQLVTLHLSTSPKGEVGMSIEVDTTPEPKDEYFKEDGIDGSISQKAIPVSRLSLYEGKKDVWVTGYIVGGDMTSPENMTLSDSVTVKSHVVISDNPLTTNPSECAPVQLSGTEAKESLCLNGPGDSKYRVKITVRGSVESYFGAIGVKNVKEFVPL